MAAYLPLWCDDDDVEPTWLPALSAEPDLEGPGDSWFLVEMLTVLAHANAVSVEAHEAMLLRHEFEFRNLGIQLEVAAREAEMHWQAIAFFELDDEWRSAGEVFERSTPNLGVAHPKWLRRARASEQPQEREPTREARGFHDIEHRVPFDEQSCNQGVSLAPRLIVHMDDLIEIWG